MKLFNSLFQNSNIDFMKAHKVAFFLSIIVTIASLALVFFKGLNFGIDFSGGVLIEVKIEKTNIAALRDIFSKSNLKEVQIQNVDGDNFLIRVAKSEDNLKKNLSGDFSLSQSELIDKIQAILNKNFTDIDYRKIDYVGPQIGAELISKGFLALILSFVFIMIYVWLRFDWQFGVGGIFALVHDAIMVVGFYSLTGIEFNLTSIAAVLTVIGYSINDSVVIYDRIRENLRKFKKSKIENIINSSLNSTLSRTVLTAFTTLLSLLALILFGGEVLRSFSVGAFFGILVGVYSSVYISAPILLYLDPRKSEKEEA